MKILAGSAFRNYIAIAFQGLYIQYHPVYNCTGLIGLLIFIIYLLINL